MFTLAGSHTAKVQGSARHHRITSQAVRIGTCTCLHTIPSRRCVSAAAPVEVSETN